MEPIRALADRTAIITGASQGLGQAIAEAYVSAGANVLLCARNGALLESVQQALIAQAAPGQQIVTQVCDVADATAVQRLAETAFARFARVDILVNNAAVHGPKGAIEAVDWDEWLQALSINLFGSILMTRALLPHFKANSYGKIVQLSGGGATSPMPFLSAYAVSKAAIVRYVETLAGEVADWHIDVNAVAPGVLNTRLLDEVIDAGPEKVGQKFFERTVQQKKDGGVPLTRGAALAVYLGSAQSDGISGRLISAVWDPWETLDKHAAELHDSDVYTLRRIIPKDRGLTGWGDDV